MSLAHEVEHKAEALNLTPVAAAAGIRDYFDLLKPRVMSLVVFTAIVGYVLAPGDLHPLLATIAILCIAVGAGASGALNMWYDADVDRLMDRTQKRPIPSGRVEASEALSLGLVLAFLSVMVLGVAVNWLSASLLAFTIFFYAVIYTAWLKRWTPQNIVIGGAAGALPPVISWAAATGGTALEPWLLFAIIFIWTPPHFWALALLTRQDYARAGLPMLPVLKGDLATRRQMLGYSVLLWPLGMAPWLFDFASPFYAFIAFALGGYFSFSCWRLLRAPLAGELANRLALKVFLVSLVYLFALFGALLADTVARHLWMQGGF